MGPYYEICPVGENVVWIVWTEIGTEKKVEASTAQRDWLAAVVDRQNDELQSVLRDIANGKCAAPVSAQSSMGG